MQPAHLTTVLPLVLLAAAAGALRCDVFDQQWLDAEFARLQSDAAPMWSDFHSRGFRVRDVADRRQLFMAAAQFVNGHNGAGEQSYCLKPNHLATLSDEEFKSTLGGRVPPPSDVKPPVAPVNASEASLPTGVYYESGRVEDQGSCGSCWAFAASHVLTSTLKVFGDLYPIEFSEQQIIDCVTNGHGCNGGGSQEVYQYFADSASNLDNDQTPYHVLQTVIPPYPVPYRAQQGTCQAKASQTRLVTGYEWAPKDSETQLMTVLAKRPTVIYFNVLDEGFRHYQYGVYDNHDQGCTTTNTNHAMSLVGYGTTAEFGDYWIVKNSWGEGWGSHGLVFIRRDSTRCAPCALCHWPLYPTVSTE